MKLVPQALNLEPRVKREGTEATTRAGEEDTKQNGNAPMRPRDGTYLKLKTIPRGQTYAGVYGAIIAYLRSLKRDFHGKAFLDLPCGRGEFLGALRSFFPTAELLGGDIDTSQFRLSEKVRRIDATQPFPFGDDVRFDVITSISGVVMFDNTGGFIRSCVNRLGEGGLLIISNENTFTVRDRITYLLFGRFRAFPLFLQPHQFQARFKRIPIEELCKIFAENGLTTEKVQYLVFDKVDYLFVPFACVLFFSRRFTVC